MNKSNNNVLLDNNLSKENRIIKDFKNLLNEIDQKLDTEK
jgi:hypothetical protein